MASSLCLLAVFAHPDDETFRPGGSLALLARSGVKVHVLTATRGQAGSCGDPPVCRLEELPLVREYELRCACEKLGLREPRFLDFHDGKLAEEDPETITNQVLSLIGEVRPQVMLSFGPDGLSRHPDHITIGMCAHQAYDKAENVAALYNLAVPVSLAEKLEMRQVQAVPDEETTLMVNVSSVWDIKRAAMDCHATQRSTTPMMSASAERQRLFFSREFFVRAAQRISAGDFMEKSLEKYLL
jgi:N-acetylglucosamine malate deacetylase 2